MRLDRLRPEWLARYLPCEWDGHTPLHATTTVAERFVQEQWRWNFYRRHGARWCWCGRLVRYGGGRRRLRQRWLPGPLRAGLRKMHSVSQRRGRKILLCDVESGSAKCGQVGLQRSLV